MHAEHSVNPTDLDKLASLSKAELWNLLPEAWRDLPRRTGFGYCGKPSKRELRREVARRASRAGSMFRGCIDLPSWLSYSAEGGLLVHIARRTEAKIADLREVLSKLSRREARDGRTEAAS